MLTKKQIEEIREHLDKAQNPIFLFDNDPDGLCSFLLLRRYCGKGTGVVIKSFPDLSVEYFKKVKELNADYIFILDKPVVSDEFFLEAKNVNLPVVWIDHHVIDKEIPSFVHYYNSQNNNPPRDNPVTSLCYQVSQREDDIWIAVAGCISDRNVPDFYKVFEKKFPDLTIDFNSAADLFYKSPIGKITKLIGSSLKDTTSNVNLMIKFLLKVNNPYEVLNENPQNHQMHRRFLQIESKYRKLLNKAISFANPDSKMLFFQYAGSLSISGELSNELMYLYPEKIVVVIYFNGLKANISVRGKNCRKKFLKAIEDIEGARGGGHENAVGGQMKTQDIETFKKNMEKLSK